MQRIPLEVCVGFSLPRSPIGKTAPSEGVTYGGPNPPGATNFKTEGLQEGRVRAESTTSSIGRVALRRDATSESPTASAFSDGRFS